MTAVSPYSLGSSVATAMLSLGAIYSSEDLWFGDCWPALDSHTVLQGPAVSLRQPSLFLLSGESFPVCVLCPLQFKAVELVNGLKWFPRAFRGYAERKRRKRENDSAAVIQR